MKNPRIPALLLLSVVSLSTGGCQAEATSSSRSAAAGAGIAFANLGFRDALAEAKKRDTLVLVSFYTDWCGWCRKMERDTFSDPEVAAAAKGMVAIRLNPEKQDDGAEMARRYDITGFPVVLLLRPDGSVERRVMGYVPPERFVKALRDLPNRS